jgi:hypothetical protein
VKILRVVCLVAPLALLAQTPPMVKTPHRGGWLVTRSERPEQFHESYYYRVASGQPVLLSWRAGVATDLFGRMSVLDGIVKADALGLAHVEGISTQKISPELRKNLDYQLTTEERAVVRNALRMWGMRMTSYRLDTLPADSASRRKVFEFAKELGADTITVAPAPNLAADLDALADEFQINVAFDDQRAAKTVLAALEGRG